MSDVKPAITPPRPGKTHIWVIGGLLLGALVFALVAYVKFVDSEERLHQDFATMRVRGVSLTADECVDAVLDWRKTCAAMELLCDRSVGRMMEMCLADGHHEAYCAEVRTQPTGRTSFGFEECKARGAHKNRKSKKICGTTYRAIAAYCRLSQKPAGPSDEIGTGPATESPKK